MNFGHHHQDRALGLDVRRVGVDLGRTMAGVVWLDPPSFGGIGFVTVGIQTSFRCRFLQTQGIVGRYLAALVEADSVAAECIVAALGAENIATVDCSPHIELADCIEVEKKQPMASIPCQAAGSLLIAEYFSQRSGISAS